MDASINISMEPFRAFVADNLPSEQRTIGYSMQSFFIGIGAVVASALPYILTNWLNIANTAAAGEIPDSVKFSFYIGGAIFFLAVLWTVSTTKEYSPEELKKFSESDTTSINHPDYQSVMDITASRFFRNGFIWLFAGLVLSAVLYFALKENDFGLYVLFLGFVAFGLVQIISGLLTQAGNTKNGFVVVTNDLYKMPTTMKQLAVVQFFSWFALFSMWIYTTPAVTHHIYRATDPTTELYNQGADWVGVLMSVYNGFAAVMAFVLVWLAKMTSRKSVHMISLIIGGLAFASFYIIQDPHLLLISELGIGLAWASILAMPYAILAGSIPPEKMGVYMGIFNFFIVIPQITAAAILGWFVRVPFGGEAIYALLLGGVSMIIAGIMVMFVKDVDEVTINN
jgi:maltose/moltooligosaccharide transporter